jgi:uncharacterized membrane protein SpoIIM required for sporulation
MSTRTGRNTIDDLLRFEELLDRSERVRPSGLGFAELRELGLLYRRHMARLAHLRERSDDPDAQRHLNALSLRAYTLLHGNRSARNSGRRSPNRAAESLVRVWPALKLSFALMALGAFIGASLAVRDTQAIWTLLPASLGHTPIMLERLVDSPEEQGRFLERSETSIGMNSLFGSRLFARNTRVGLLALATGMLAGFPTVILQLYNGMILGAFASIFIGGPWWIEFLAWILPHGIPEITAICLCVSGGLMLGGAVLAPGRRTRRVAIRESMNSASLLFAVSVPLFFLAAGIESFVRQSSLGTATRLGVAAAMLVLLGIGAFAVRRLSVRHDPDVVWLSDLRQAPE